MDQPIINHHPSNSMIKIVFTLLVALAIPISVTLVQQRQDIRQHAAEKEPSVITPQPTAVHAQEPINPIHGYVYMDTNRNGYRDFEEKPAAGIQVMVARRLPRKDGTAQLSQNITINTDSNGYFTVKPDGLGNEGNLFTVTITPPAGYQATITPSLTINGSSNAVMEFGITQTVGSTAPTPVITQNCIPRPACLDATPRCLMAEPANGWCKPTVPQVTSVKPPAK